MSTITKAKAHDSSKGVPITHETILIGFNKKNQIVFFKSYQYAKQKNICQKDANWIAKNCAYWELGHVSEWFISHENRPYLFNIPKPNM